MSKVEELLREKVEEVFLECQEKREIRGGSITPTEALKLDTLITDLAQHISDVLDRQYEDTL